MCVVGVSWSAQEGGVAILCGIAVVTPLDLEFIHTLHIPLDSSFGPMHFKRHVAFGSIDDPARFQHATRAIFKLHQGADVILVGHFTHWAFATANIVVCAAPGLGNGSPTEKNFFVAGDSGDRTS